MANNKITLFESGIGNSDDLLLGFPNSDELETEGMENFYINHRIKGYDGSKIIPYHPLKSFLYMAKAEYSVNEPSKVGLIDVNVHLLKPHNYTFKLISQAQDKDGKNYYNEFVLEGTLNRDTVDYTIIEFDEKSFIPVDDEDKPFIEDSNKINYKIKDMSNGIFNICFEDGTTETTGFKKIKAKVLDKNHFQHLLSEEKDIVAGPIIKTKTFDRDKINSIFLPKVEYPNQKGNINIDYDVNDIVKGRIINYGVTGNIKAGMDFPYKIGLYFQNPYCLPTEYHLEKYYHNIHAKTKETTDIIPLTNYLKQPYDAIKHGESFLKTYNELVNLDPITTSLDPKYINPEVEMYQIDQETNKLNLNNIISLETTGLTALNNFTEKEILQEFIYDEKMFIIFKTREITNKELYCYNTRIHYEVLDMSTCNAITTGIIFSSNNSIDIEKNENNNLICATSSDIFIEKSNIHINGSKMHLVAELIESYIYKHDNNNIDNTVSSYELFQIDINMDSNGYSCDSILKKEYKSEINDFLNLIKTSYLENGKDKLIISPSCKSDLVIKENNEDRIDIVFKQIVAKKSTYTGQSSDLVLSEDFNIHYVTKDAAPSLIVSSPDPFILDSGDTLGVASNFNNLIVYYKTINRSTQEDLNYEGKFIDLDSSNIYNIDFEFSGIIKVISYHDSYLVIRLKDNLIHCVKLNSAILQNINLSNNEITNNGLIPILNKNIVNNHIFRSNTNQNFNDWYQIEEIINTIDLSTINSPLIYKDRHHLSYTNDSGYIGNRTQGDFLDFMLNYNKSQMQILENKIIWYGIANTKQLNGNNAVYTFQTELSLNGYDNITNIAQIYNNARLTTTQLFEIDYKDAENKEWSQTGKFYKETDDVFYYTFLINNKINMFNKRSNTLFTWDIDLLPMKRTQYITDLVSAEHTVNLPEAGFLIAADILDKNTIILLEKNSTELIKMLKTIGTEKKIPTEKRYSTNQFKLKFYNFKNIDNVSYRYSTNMPYEPGDNVTYQLKENIIDFRGEKIIENRQYASLSSIVNDFNGETSLIVSALKRKDMDYTYELNEQVVEFSKINDNHISNLLSPFVSINEKPYEENIDNNIYQLQYLKDYINDQDYSSSMSFSFNENKLTIINTLEPIDYNLTFNGIYNELVSVSKTDIFNKKINQSDMPLPTYKKLTYKGTKYYNMIATVDNELIKTKKEIDSLIYFTNYSQLGEEIEKEFKAEKLGGHTNSFIYWKSNPGPSIIAKTDNESINTKTDEVLCFLAAEENILLKSEVYTNWYVGSVNGIDDLGNEVDPIMLADEDYVLNTLKKQGIKNFETRIIDTGIMELIPETTATDPVFSIIIDNESVQYELIKTKEDVGLNNQQTIQNKAIVRFSSNYKTEINLAKPAYTEQKKLGLCSITASQVKADYIIPIANPNKNNFYYEDNSLAANITVHIPEVIATSENIILKIDYKETLKNINPNIDTQNLSNKEIWELIIGNTNQALILLYVNAEIAFLDQIAWNPNINIGTYYLNDQEMSFLPENKDIVLISSDYISFSTAPVPVEDSPIELINNTSGKKYKRVFFLNNDNEYSIYNTEKIKFTDGNTGILAYDDIDISSIKLSVDRKIDFLSGNLLKIQGTMDPTKEVEITYCLINSFAANINSQKNNVNFDVHCNEENAKFSVNYATNKINKDKLNVNPLQSLNRGFIQI
jgi:hypothetical protein